MSRPFGLKDARIGLWSLKRERAALDKQIAVLELEVAVRQERIAVIDRQLPEYEKAIARFTADPRDDFSAAQHADEAADLGAYDGAA